MLKKLEKVEKPIINHSQNRLFKDFEKNKFIRIFPELESLISKLSLEMFEKKYLTIDFSYKIFKKGDKSCVNPGWHVDGEQNQYLILCFGDFRTNFYNQRVELTDSLVENNKIIKKIESSFLKEHVFEAPNGIPILYDSKQIHQGRIADRPGERMFLRLCYSDYLVPKNFVKSV